MTNRELIGWREWISLPELNVPHIKAKVDTGARTSALHAFAIDTVKMRGRWIARFKIHPFQKRTDIVKVCEAEIIDQRWVTDSGGHREQRYVILTTAQVSSHRWAIEMTLTDRDIMKFRMLLGRTALDSRFIVDPRASYLVGTLPPGRKKRIIPRT